MGKRRNDNMPMDYKIAELEEKHILSTLLFLMDNDGCKKIDLYHSVSPNPRMPAKLGILEKMGLIRIDQESKRCNIFLTDKGKIICESLKEMEEAL